MSELAITGWRKNILDSLFGIMGVDDGFIEDSNYTHQVISKSKIPAYQISKDTIVLFPIYEEKIISRKQALKALYKYSFEKIGLSKERESDVSLFLDNDILKFILVIIGDNESVRSPNDETYACIMCNDISINNVISMHNHPLGSYHTPSVQDISCFEAIKKLELGPLYIDSVNDDYGVLRTYTHRDRLFSYTSFIFSEYGFFDLIEMYDPDDWVVRFNGNRYLSRKTRFNGNYYLSKKANRICHKIIDSKSLGKSTDILESKSIGGYRWILEDYNFPKEKYNIVDMGI